MAEASTAVDQFSNSRFDRLGSQQGAILLLEWITNDYAYDYLAFEIPDTKNDNVTHASSFHWPQKPLGTAYERDCNKGNCCGFACPYQFYCNSIYQTYLLPLRRSFIIQLNKELRLTFASAYRNFCICLFLPFTLCAPKNRICICITKHDTNRRSIVRPKKNAQVHFTTQSKNVNVSNSISLRHYDSIRPQFCTQFQFQRHCELSVST